MLTKTSCEAPDSPEGGDAPRGDGVWLTADMFKRGEKLYFDGVLIWPLDEEPGEIVHRWAANDVRNEIPRPPKDTMYPDGGMWLTRDMLVPGETLYYNGIRIWPAKPLPGETIHKSSSQK